MTYRLIEFPNKQNVKILCIYNITLVHILGPDSFKIDYYICSVNTTMDTIYDISINAC